MDQALYTALSQPDVDGVLLSAVEHADTSMRRYIWRGCRPKRGSSHQLMVGDKTSDDFVQEALERLCDGTRSYNAQKSLLDNLNSVTDSLIWSEKKSSDRTGVVDFVQDPADAGQVSDPILKAIGTQVSADVAIIDKEKTESQKKCFLQIQAAFDGDQETQNYLEALSQEFFDIEEISQLTGIPIKRIYEIRRKLKDFAPKFFGVAKYGHMKRKIDEGQ